MRVTRLLLISAAGAMRTGLASRTLRQVTHATGQNLPPAAKPAPAIPPVDHSVTTARRRRISVRTRLDFWFDAVLLVTYTLAYSVGFTRLPIHEWLGIGLGLALLAHFTLHWEWVIRTTRRLLGRRGRDRAVWLASLALLLAMTLCIASGILISQVALPAFGISRPLGGFWYSLHHLTATLTLLLVPVHAALRWRWLASVGKRILPGRGGRSR